MANLNTWNDCRNIKPKKKGTYLLMVGVRNSYIGYTEIGIIDAFWNGIDWGVNEKYALFKWKKACPGEIDKYPDFETNNRRRDLL